MNDTTPHANTISVMLEKAQSALKAGDKKEARTWAEKILATAPENVDAHLILAAIGSPKESLRHLTRVLELDPQNKKARNGMRWAIAQAKLEKEQDKQTSSKEDTQKIKVKASSTAQKNKKEESAKTYRYLGNLTVHRDRHRRIAGIQLVRIAPPEVRF